MDLQRYLQHMEERTELNPIEELVAMFQREHSGSGMRTHLELLGAIIDPYECFCRLKKYGLDTFDPTKMPLTWKGCGNCR
jgi:hypothetical protein